MADVSTSGPSRRSRSTSPKRNRRTSGSSVLSDGDEDDLVVYRDGGRAHSGDRSPGHADHGVPREPLMGTKGLRGSDEVEDLSLSYEIRPEEDVGLAGVEPGHERHRHATVEMKKALWWRNVLVTGMFILSWYGFATLLSLYNKWMFSPQYYGFSYPLFVTCCHMIVQFCLAAIVRVVFADKYRPKERPTRREYILKILPTSAATGGDIGLSNLSLKTITLSLYTMCKSSTLIFVLLFAFTFKLESYSLRLLSVISLISFGVFCMVFNTTDVSIPGIVMVFVASVLGGLRWALTELVMHKKGMGLSNPFATIFWLAPLMAATLIPLSLILEDWFGMLRSDFFSGAQTIRTMGVIVFPGALAFAMVASEYFIIQRAGVVPLSIAGIFKEVSTISVSAWVFGDQLTKLNIVGVVITICGIALYSYHKYQKSIASTVELDARGDPIKEDDRAPLMDSTSNRYVTTPQADPERYSGVGTSRRADPAVPLSELDRERPKAKDHSYPPSMAEETEEERTRRLRDDFEGWGRVDDEWSEDDEEAGEDEVQRRREERTGGKRWGEWWDKAM
ncbi:hypothetical protein IAU60_002477 [Kwoniella sp. DSM 27419]